MGGFVRKPKKKKNVGFYVKLRPKTKIQETTKDNIATPGLKSNPNHCTLKFVSFFLAVSIDFLKYLLYLWVFFCGSLRCLVL